MSRSSFDEGAFVAEVERQLSAGDAALDEVVDLGRAGPKFLESDRIREPAVEAARKAARLYEAADNLLIVLASDKKELRTLGASWEAIPDRRVLLRPFFGGGRVPEISQKPADDVARRVVVRLFPRTVAITRRCLKAFLDSDLRTTWSYPTMDQISLLSDEDWSRAGQWKGGFNFARFGNMFWTTMLAAQGPLFRLVVFSRPLRRRLAEDTDHLDDLARSIVSNLAPELAVVPKLAVLGTGSSPFGRADQYWRSDGRPVHAHCGKAQSLAAQGGQRRERTCRGPGDGSRPVGVPCGAYGTTQHSRSSLPGWKAPFAARNKSGNPYRRLSHRAARQGTLRAATVSLSGANAFLAAALRPTLTAVITAGSRGAR
ncbi:hypothetical protein DFJ74DRAFT_689326 [Hyaloraphidium curvatum]|nr:hypothetical protein DFJ74DRAFT_689326 [Hyaloraphidium curvatum]